MSNDSAILYGILALILFTGCSTQPYTKQESLFVVFKTPSLKHADLGFLYENTQTVKLEMYSNGQAIKALEIKHERICLGQWECLDKQGFNREILSADYPKDILENIFRGQVIFGGKNRQDTGNGFTQSIIKKDKYQITYSVFNTQIVFHDTINAISIKLQRLD
ncbi:MAG: hypothetical protein Q9M36_15005 [Sulfurovum sp.]|nr:hypothetical protein [Sulfurovum sp.]